MPAYDAPLGAPVWMDLMSTDTDKAVQFYSALFGWTAEEPNAEFGGYRNFTMNGNRVAGLMTAPENPEEGPQNVWGTYLRVADAAATLEAVGKAGGEVYGGVMPVGDLGTMAILADPAGAVIGIWQPGTHPGFIERGEPGTPYWFDSLSQNYETAVPFYRDVFGVKPHEIAGEASEGPERYTQLLTSDGDAYAGVMDAKGMFDEGHPSFWQVYITVDDPAASAARAVELGGEIVAPPEETPWGTIGTIKDPNGAFLCIAKPPAGM